MVSIAGICLLVANYFGGEMDGLLGEWWGLGIYRSRFVVADDANTYHVRFARSFVRAVRKTTSSFASRACCFFLADRHYRAIGGAKQKSFARRMWGPPEMRAKLDAKRLRHKPFRRLFCAAAFNGDAKLACCRVGFFRRIANSKNYRDCLGNEKKKKEPQRNHGNDVFFSSLRCFVVVQILFL